MVDYLSELAKAEVSKHKGDHFDERVYIVVSSEPSKREHFASYFRCHSGFEFRVLTQNSKNNLRKEDNCVVIDLDELIQAAS